MSLNAFGQQRIYTTARVDGEPPEIDGFIDETAWEAAEWAGDFIQKEPNIPKIWRLVKMRRKDYKNLKRMLDFVRIPEVDIYFAKIFQEAKIKDVNELRELEANTILEMVKPIQSQESSCIEELDIEMINPRMDFEFLNLLANETKGEFAFADDYEKLINKIRRINEKTRKDKIITSDISLWSYEWLMAIVIFLFSLEWFLRKRAGML